MPLALRALSTAAALLATALLLPEALAEPQGVMTAPGAAAPTPSPLPSPGYAAAPTPIGSPGATPGASPYYAPPSYYYAPGATLPLILPYEPGQPVPPGYRVKTRASRSLIISGAVTFGVPYVVSVLIASTVLSADTNSGEPLAPLFIPFAGPFITIGTTHALGVASFWLVLDGLAQTGGAALFAAGLLSEDRYLQRVGAPPPAARLLPEVRVAPGFTTLRWRF